MQEKIWPGQRNFIGLGNVFCTIGRTAHKGFSFQVDQGLDMRYNDQMNILTAEKIVNEWPEEKIEGILEDYGEEKFAKKIAKEYC